MFEFYWLSDFVSVVWLTTFIYRNKYLKGCSSQAETWQVKNILINSSLIRFSYKLVACVAWRFWSGALRNTGGRGQRNREEIVKLVLNVISLQTL